MSDTSSSLGIVMLVLFLGMSWVLSRKADAVIAENAAAEAAARLASEKEARKRERHARAGEKQRHGKGARKRTG